MATPHRGGACLLPCTASLHTTSHRTIHPGTLLQNYNQFSQGTAQRHNASMLALHPSSLDPEPLTPSDPVMNPTFTSLSQEKQTLYSCPSARLAPRLPQEIHDEIVGFLHDDQEALRNCSLVCRAWLHRARRHLFRIVLLDPSPRSCSFVKLCQTCPDVQPLVCDLELRGRAATSKAFWESEQTFDIVWPTLNNTNGNGNTGPWRREPDALEVLSWMRLTFAPADGAPPLLVLPKIETLRLSETTFNADTAAFLARVFPRVGTLALNGCRAMSFADLVRLFQAFPRLHTLRLHSAEWLPHRPGGCLPACAEGACARLRRLEMARDIYVEPLVDWLLKVAAHKTVRALKCSIATRKSATALRNFLRASRAVLESLSVTLSESRDPTAILEATQLELSPCVGLRSLHLQCSPFHTESSHRSLSWVLILLSKVRSSHLNEVTLSIRTGELSLLNLGGLDVVLRQNCIDRLQRLTFDVDDTLAPRRGRPAVEAMLREGLPTANARKLIKLEYRS